MGRHLGGHRRRGESLRKLRRVRTDQWKAPEGPHIYHKDGYYYLLVAEGK